ncbi:MAG: F0F1 ATP synthase subunit A [Myxococcales bacterium]|nr:F0F1 ATP synthase subunit A [Myxococcales bacterium]
MPHGETWFSLLPFYHSLQVWISKTFGPTWLEHTETLKIQPILGFAAVVLTLVIAGFFIRRRLQRPEEHILPEGRVTPFSFIEMLVGATYNMMKDVMGPQAAKYFLPLVGTCALVIFFSNIMGLLPGFLPPTDNLTTNFAMAIVIFFATHIYGVREHGFFRYFRHFAGPPLPIAIAIFIYPLMFVIETISHIVRPVTLAVRLMANMTADHMVLGIFVAAFAAGAMGISLFWLPVPVAFYLLGCLVVVVQTLVFCLLATIYIALAIQHEEGH